MENKISFFLYKRDNIIRISLNTSKVSRSRGVNLDDPLKVNFTCESKVEGSYTMNPIPWNISKDDVVTWLGCIFLLFRGLEKSICIEGSIKHKIEH